jgi:serine/threonine protein kinase
MPNAPDGALDALPWPLPQLIQRAENTKAAMERLHCVYFVAEAALKLATTARIALYLDKALEPGSREARQLECLVHPSIGHWRQTLGWVNTALKALPDAESIPLARVAGKLRHQHEEWSAVRSFASHLSDTDLLKGAKRAYRGGVQGFFETVVSYRNEVIGHGAVKKASFYHEQADLLLPAVKEVLGCREVLDGIDFAVPANGERWHRLTGPTPPTTRPPAGTVHVVGEGICLPAHPFVVWDSEHDRVGLLNRTRYKTKGNRSDVDRVHHLDYLDGERLAVAGTVVAFREFLSQLRGSPVTEADLDATVARAASETDEPDLIGPGETIGDFEILDELGRGGMGVVYRVRQLTTGRVLALKVLSSSDATLLRRFEREVAALRRCDHPNVVKVMVTGVDDGRHYFVMEHVDGLDLAEVSRRLNALRAAGTEVHALTEVLEDPVSDDRRSVGSETARDALPRSLAHAFAGAAAGLAHMHAERVVHRDVKPSNLMLTADGRVVVADLGLAQLGDASTALTDSNVRLLGTLGYTAPERLEGEASEIDHRVDIYGLGAALYEVATGRRMHDGDTESRLVQQVLNEKPPPARKVQAGIPASLSDVIATAVSKRPAARYQTAADLERDLRAVAEQTSPPTVTRRRRRRRARVAAVVAGVLTATAAVVLALALPGYLERRRARRDPVGLIKEHWRAIAGGDAAYAWSTVTSRIKDKFRHSVDHYASKWAAYEICRVDVEDAFVREEGEREAVVVASLKTWSRSGCRTVSRSSRMYKLLRSSPGAEWKVHVSPYLGPEDWLLVYWRAVARGDYVRSWSLLDPEYRRSHYRGSFPYYADSWKEVKVCSFTLESLTLKRTTEDPDGEHAVVYARLVRRSGDSCHRVKAEPHDFHLRRRGNRWRIFGWSRVPEER